jgi:hypothetical protein
MLASALGPLVTIGTVSALAWDWWRRPTLQERIGTFDQDHNRTRTRTRCWAADCVATPDKSICFTMVEQAYMTSGSLLHHAKEPVPPSRHPAHAVLTRACLRVSPDVMSALSGAHEGRLPVGPGPGRSRPRHLSPRRRGRPTAGLGTSRGLRAPMHLPQSGSLPRPGFPPGSRARAGANSPRTVG